MTTESFAFSNRFGREEAPAENFGDIVFGHRLDALFALTAENRVEVGGDLLA